MNINIDNEITASIDAQLIIAPQYGIVGLAPRIDPPSGSNDSQKSCHRIKPSAFKVENLRTRDLKQARDILTEEIKCVQTGRLLVSQPIADAMLERLEIMNQEMVRRDYRDYSAKKRSKIAAQGASAGFSARKAA
jgi:hypothetical protein